MKDLLESNTCGGKRRSRIGQEEFRYRHDKNLKQPKGQLEQWLPVGAVLSWCKWLKPVDWRLPREEKSLTSPINTSLIHWQWDAPRRTWLWFKSWGEPWVTEQLKAVWKPESEPLTEAGSECDISVFDIECLQTKKKKGIQSNGKLFKAHVYTVYTRACTHTRMYTKAEKCFNLAT